MEVSIKAWRETKERAEDVRKKLETILGRGRLNSYAFDSTFRATLVKVPGVEDVAKIEIDAWYNFAGQVHYVLNPAVIEYLSRALNECLPQIAERAIELAEADVEKARREAEAEAREVLQEVRQSV